MVEFSDFHILQNLREEPHQKTYLVESDLIETKPLILKRFCFDDPSDWYGMEAIAPQIERLKDLEHFGIPAYLEVFPTENGFCFVREYKEGQPLSSELNLSMEQIYNVAINLLEILVYLQQWESPIYHLNIKPNNVILDGYGNVNLTDFFVDYRELSKREILSQRFQFAAPEYWQEKTLTRASDVYSAGALLICLFTNTPVEKLPDLYEGDRINFALSDSALGEWLSQTIKPNPRYRLPSASDALEALLPLASQKIVPKPKAFMRLGRRNYQLSHEKPRPIIFNPHTYGDLGSASFTVSNPRSELELSGEWQLTDEDSRWITITPSSFTGNETRFLVQVDTHNLQAREIYERQIHLHTNGEPPVASVQLRVVTADFAKKPGAWISAAGIVLIFLSSCWTFTVGYDFVPILATAIIFVPLLYWRDFFTMPVAASGGGLWVLSHVLRSFDTVMGGNISAMSSFIALMAIAAFTMRKSLDDNVSFLFAIPAVTFAVLGGLGLALILRSWLLGWPILLLSLIIVLCTLLYPDWQYYRRFLAYRQRLPHLIVP